MDPPIAGEFPLLVTLYDLNGEDSKKQDYKLVIIVKEEE